MYGNASGSEYIKIPRMFGVPDGIRTHGLKIRNLALYPAELREPQANISFSLRGLSRVLAESATKFSTMTPN